jgi:hypothetical protein
VAADTARPAAQPVYVAAVPLHASHDHAACHSSSSRWAPPLCLCLCLCPCPWACDVVIAPADDDEEFWAAWHARHPQPPAPAAASVTTEAASLGRDAGKAAASWIFHGNTPEDAYRAVLRGIDDGDPAILDTHPAPSLSAGDGYSEADLARDLGLDSEDRLPPEAVPAYLDAAAGTFWDETERLAREHLAGTGLAVTGTEPGR